MRKPTRISWLRPGSGWPIDSSSSRASSSGRSISSDSIFASMKTASAGATRARSSSRNAGVGQLGLVDVEHVEERLGGEQVQLAQLGPGRCPRPAAPAYSVVPPSSSSRAAFGRGDRGGPVLAELGLLLQPRQRLLERLQVGQDQLGVDRLDVVGRARPCRRRAPRSGRRRRARPGRSPRRRGCWPGTRCPGPGPSTRRGPGRRCRRTTPAPGTIFCESNISASLSSRASGSPTTPTLGSIVANG